MPITTVTCDRCKRVVEGLEFAGSEAAGQLGGTSGFYRCRDLGEWDQFANEGEKVVCDACMFKDPRYRRVYPQPGQLTVTFEELCQIFARAEHDTAAYFDGRTCSLLNKDGRHECPICYFSREVHKALAATDPDVPRPMWAETCGR